MWREILITKERVENYYKRKYYQKVSVNEDLEKLFEDIQLGKEPDDYVDTYFLPKLTKTELDLVERKDSDFIKTFSLERYADVPKAEMLLSESDAKFVLGLGKRETFTIENSLPKNHTEKSIQNRPLHKKEAQSSKNKILNRCFLQ